MTPAVEAVVEANTLLSGLGFESGGLAGAHAVHNGLTVLEASHAKFHGQKVAFGVLTQMVLEGRPSKDLDQVLDFCLERGVTGLFGGSGRFQPEPRGHKESGRGNHGRGRDYSFHLVPRDR